MAYAQQHVIAEGETPPSSAHMNAEIQYIIAAINGHDHDGTKGALLDISKDTSPAFGGDVDARSKQIMNVKRVGFPAEVDNGDSGTAKTIDLSAGQNHLLTLTGDCAVTWSNPAVGHYTLKVKQDATGGRALTLPSGRWSCGVAFEPTADAFAVDVLSLYWDGSEWWYSVVGVDMSVPM